jgi:hypothetical protein
MLVQRIGVRTGRWGLMLLIVSGLTCSVAIAEGNKLEPSGEIPILAWGGPPATAERLREMKEAGLTISFTGFADVAAAIKGLDAAREAGVKLLVSCPQLQTDPEGTARQLKTHPALAGYFLRDEPSAQMFPELAIWMKRLREADPDHDSYINLFPNYATASQLGVATYHQYIAEFMIKVPATFISFDHYPVMQPAQGPPVLRGEWYDNLEQVAAACKRAKRPMWAFALSTKHFSYPTATLAHLRVQVFSDLAYGAQCIQYFTYWQVAGSDGFSDAPLLLDGKRSPVYDRVKQMNAEVRALAGVFAGAELIDVAHTGDAIPRGTRRYEPRPPVAMLKTDGTGAVISLLRNGGRQFLVIVNRDINAAQTVSVTLDGSSQAATAARVEKDATLRNLDGRAWETKLDPGDVAILTWTDTH